MVITALKAQVKDAQRVSVFVDNAYSFSMSLDDILQYAIKKNLVITEADVALYKKVSSDGKVRARTYEWLMNRPHSTSELKKYLYQKKVDKDLQQKLVDEFTQKGIVQDDVFAQWTTDRLVRKNTSRRAVIAQLRAKGIASEDAAAVVGDTSSDMVAIKNLIAKLSGRPRYSDPKKLTTYLLSKGFMYQDIKEALTLREPEQEL